jgi:hypothetical protein
VNLQDLNNIQRESTAHSDENKRLEWAQEFLASVRNGNNDLVSIIALATERWRLGSDEAAKNALFGVINEQKHELIRLAELKLAALAREQKIKAAQKQALIMASIVNVRDGGSA